MRFWAGRGTSPRPALFCAPPHLPSAAQGSTIIRTSPQGRFHADLHPQAFGSGHSDAAVHQHRDFSSAATGAGRSHGASPADSTSRSETENARGLRPGRAHPRPILEMAGAVFLDRAAGIDRPLVRDNFCRGQATGDFVADALPGYGHRDAADAANALGCRHVLHRGHPDCPAHRHLFRLQTILGL